jgi:hypothetical protein
MNKSEHILSGRIHKSWIPILIVAFMISILGSICGLFLANDTLSQWSKEYTGIETFATIQEAQNYQSLLFTAANEYNAKIKVSISVQSPPTVTFYVKSEQPFPYGNNNPPLSPNELRIGISALGFMLGAMITLSVFRY